MTKLFSNSSPKIPKPGVFGPILEIDKLEHADFKYDNSIFQILAEKHPKNTSLIWNLSCFFFVKFVK